MDFVHAILHRIAKTVEYVLNITSADFLANMDDPRFAKSRKRWNSFAAAVDSENQFGGFKLVGKDSISMPLWITTILGRGSLNAGTFVAQVFHWFYVGLPRATTSYRACVNVLFSSKQVHLSLLRKMMRVHSIQSVFDRCAHRSKKEQTQICTVLSLDRSKNLERLSSVTVA